MKKFLLILFVSISLKFSAQTVLFTENFDALPLSTTASSTNGNPTWSLNTTFQVNGTSSDSAKVQLSDTLILESNAFSTVGFTFVTLTFSQICKVDFFDKGVIQYSMNNGTSWTTLTSVEYTGTGFLNNNSFSAVSYTTWDVVNATSIPTNTWWKPESFDLSASGGQSQVKIRFLLIDADNNGARSHYGWLVDDIEVVGSPCEVIPPSIVPTGIIYQGAVFGTGPYLVQADITDASGIATATLDYTVNGGSLNTLSMNLSVGSIYEATIPAASVGDVICYTIIAIDNTTCANRAQNPGTACTQFTVNQSAPANCVGSPISNFNYSESFANFTAGNGRNPGGLGSLNNNWTNSSVSAHEWWVYNTNTRSTNTGPTTDHSSGDANYMYVEASGFGMQEARLLTPCYNFGGLFSPKFSFWYHMWGTNMGELHVDINNGGSWILDVAPVITGDQGNNWLFREIDLTAYAGNIVQLRFRGILGNGIRSDIAIDDIEINEPIANDLSLESFITPNSSSCNGSANEIVTVRVENLGSATQDTIPLAYRVNGGLIRRDTSFFSLAPAMSFNHTFQPTFDMSVAGNYVLDAWLELPSDAQPLNDSNLAYMVTTNSILTSFPDTTNFDNFTVGIPGVFVGGWSNESQNVFDWHVHTGATPSNIGTGQTGPTGDTTTSLANGNYVYFEATNVPQGEVSVLSSTCIDISNTNKPELKFFYHMFGIEMGELHIDLVLNGFTIQDIIPTITGDQGNLWKEETIDLTAYKGDVRIIFRAIRGSGYRSDIAIDQVSLRDAQPLSLEQYRDDNRVNIFPNPVENSLFLELIEKAEVRVINSNGKLLYKEILPAGQQIIESHDWSSGIYLISVQQRNMIVTKKIVKK
ncbi:MAG: T9SS type A sorting domain-containing protein [Flavobacteriales bacterium]|nr:T9SS type A sorting domain-containing protein [Flavobacteriales bacterium]